jgi:sugar phosphate isomerase/epimerase
MLHVLANMNQPISRRDFVKTSLITATALSMNAPLWAQGAASPRISVQLYSVRDDCAKDFDPALAQLAKMGFAGVEFAGYHKYSGKPKELRKTLDDLNLIAAGTHIGTGSFRGEELKRTIEFHQIIGCKYLVVPGDRDFTDPEKSKALAETFNQTAAALKPLGMYCGYHNHTHEFTKVGDSTYWHLFAERTSKDVVLQQDCGWSAAAGYNPVDLIKKFPGRTKITHFKPTVLKDDPAKKPILGEDSVDWRAVLAACRQFGATEWITVEQEVYLPGKSPMECTEMSLAGLKKIW